MSTEALPPQLARPSRVPSFQNPIPEPVVEGWKAQVAVESYAATSLAKAMCHAILASLDHELRSNPTYDAIDPSCVESSILGLANDIQAILGDALTTATTMFPHNPPATPNKGTLPRHLWPESVRHYVSIIRRRAKAVRRLVKQETNTLTCAKVESFTADLS